MHVIAITVHKDKHARHKDGCDNTHSGCTSAVPYLNSVINVSILYSSASSLSPYCSSANFSNARTSYTNEGWASLRRHPPTLDFVQN